MVAPIGLVSVTSVACGRASSQPLAGGTHGVMRRLSQSAQQAPGRPLSSPSSQNSPVSMIPSPQYGPISWQSTPQWPYSPLLTMSSQASPSSMIPLPQTATSSPRPQARRSAKGRILRGHRRGIH